MMKTTSGVLSLALLGAMCSCSASDEGQATETVAFSLRYDGAEVGCADSMQGVGTSDSDIELRDARFFIHDIKVVTEDGASHELKLDSTEWQRDGVALIDFADDTGLCETGSPETNRTITGTHDAEGDVVEIEFTLGLPKELNHLDAARSPAPLNASGMAWSWTGGYKYARIDARSEANENWYIHLGATGCEGSPAEGIECLFENRARIQVDGLSETPTIVLDLEKLYEGSDLDAPIDYQTDFVNGCMAFSGDPECAPIFEALGMTFEDENTTAQSAFHGE